MNTEQLNEYRKRLEAQLAELHQSVESHSENLDKAHDTPDTAGGDWAQEIENQETDTAILESEQNLSRKIEHALGRIEKGTYTECESCGGEIPAARLDAKPSVSLCVECQEAHEADTAAD